MGFRRDTAHFADAAYTAPLDGICALHHADRFLGCEDMQLVTLGARTVMFAACLSNPSDRARVFTGMRPADTARRLATGSGAAPPADKIFRWDLDTEEVVELELRGFGGGRDAAFHGLDVAQLADGSLSLYVVNHALAGSTIEKFTTRDPLSGALVHALTVPVAANLSPNAVHAVPQLDGDSAFYMTSDHRHARGALHLVEDLTRRPWGSVHYHAAGTWRTAMEGIAGANGITGNRARPGGRLYVSALLEGAVVVADELDGAVTELQRVPLAFAGDNLALTGSGADLYVAGHLTPHRLVAHVEGRDAGGAGSVVARFGTAQLGSGFFGAGFTVAPTVEEVLVDVGGRWVNGSTTAVFRERDGAQEGDLYVTGLMSRGESISGGGRESFSGGVLERVLEGVLEGVSLSRGVSLKPPRHSQTHTGLTAE